MSYYSQDFRLLIIKKVNKRINVFNSYFHHYSELSEEIGISKVCNVNKYIEYNFNCVVKKKLKFNFHSPKRKKRNINKTIFYN